MEATEAWYAGHKAKSEKLTARGEALRDHAIKKNILRWEEAYDAHKKGHERAMKYAKVRRLS